MKDFEKVYKCLLCDGGLTNVHNFGKTPLANEFSEYGSYLESDLFDLRLTHCRACRNVQLDTIVNQERLFKDYLYVSSTSPVNQKHFNDYALSLIQDDLIGIKKTTDYVCDIGSNDGLFLKTFKDHGFDIVGVDPAVNIAEKATRSGIPTLAEFFTVDVAKKIVNSKKYKCGLITANNIFAHTRDLGGVITSVLELIKDDGVFIFENSYLLDMLDKNILDIQYHEHIYTHSIYPMAKFLRKFGLKIFRVNRIPNQGGSIRVFCCKNSSNRKIESSVFKCLELEKNIDVKLKDFSRKIDALKDKVSLALNKYQTVDIYGYPAKTTTLLYGLELTKRGFRKVYDDAELKQGKFTPGLNLQVLHPDDLYNDPPELLFIGGWNFAKSIVAKHKSYIINGGTVLIPLPELQIVNKSNINEYLSK